MTHHIVRVEPAGWEVSVRAAETLLDAAFRIGRGWPTVCFGQSRCTACHVTVLAGMRHTGEPDEAERRVLERIARRKAVEPSRLRLACRLYVGGDVVVRHDRITADPPTPDLGHTSGEAPS